uniref:Protein wntless n=1 Tax=Macrostomum lignano TaxID=282301 RepID=A0A1I8GIB1_9PLAT
MLPAVRQYGLSFIMVLLSLTTVYFFDRTTRLFINLALLHILIFNWSPAGHYVNAMDIWYAMCTFVICCCLMAALAKKSNEPGDQELLDEVAAAEDPLQLPRSAKHSYNGTMIYQKDPRSSKCTA